MKIVLKTKDKEMAVFDDVYLRIDLKYENENFEMLITCSEPALGDFVKRHGENICIIEVEDTLFNLFEN